MMNKIVCTFCYKYTKTSKVSYTPVIHLSQNVESERSLKVKQHLLPIGSEERAVFLLQYSYLVKI